jgi:phenylacetate-CoA ligase
MMSPGPIFEPECAATDGYGAARALFAAGFRPGDIVHNAFSYHLTPGAFIFESGLHVLGCAVIPGGTGNTDQQREAIAQFRASGYVGTPDFLKILLDGAERSAPGSWHTRGGGPAMLRRRRGRRHRLRDRRARRHGGERARHR